MKRWLLGIGLVAGLAVMGVRAAEPQPAAAQPAPVAVKALPMEIKPLDAKVFYTGRFDLRDAKGPKFQWSHSMVTLRFRGTDLQVKLADSKENFYQVIVDGKDAGVLTTTKGDNVLDLARGLKDDEHQVSLVRRTEAFVGTSQFLGFYLNAGGSLLEPVRPAHKIEVIGDSISCGYGNESKNEKEHYAPKTENAYMTYGALAARTVNAEYVCIAWSGKKMSPDNTLPELYDLTLPQDKSSSWDFSKWTPDVVLINLATNDFGKVTPDPEKWPADYVAFVQRVRKNYPNAMIYLASGTMMYGAKLATLKEYMDRIQKELTSKGDTKIRVIHFGTQNQQRDGLGGDWHPNLKTHGLMAKKFADALQADLGWAPATAAP